MILKKITEYQFKGNECFFSTVNTKKQAVLTFRSDNESSQGDGDKSRGLKMATLGSIGNETAE